VTLETAVQRACPAAGLPGDDELGEWADAAYCATEPGGGALALTLRLVDEGEARDLNRRYRGRGYATNVLSFPLRSGDGIDTGLLGDVVICPAVLSREAREQGKAVAAHCAHLVVHGVLHCCGHEHESAAGAARMEALEREILAEFGFADPYTVHDEQ